MSHFHSFVIHFAGYVYVYNVYTYTYIIHISHVLTINTYNHIYIYYMINHNYIYIYYKDIDYIYIYVYLYTWLHHTFLQRCRWVWFGLPSWPRLMSPKVSRAAAIQGSLGKSYDCPGRHVGNLIAMFETL